MRAYFPPILHLTSAYLHREENAERISRLKNVFLEAKTMTAFQTLYVFSMYYFTNLFFGSHRLADDPFYAFMRFFEYIT